MAADVVKKNVNYYVRRAQNGKSAKLNKEKQKLKIGNLIAHHFYKILNAYLYSYKAVHNWV